MISGGTIYIPEEGNAAFLFFSGGNGIYIDAVFEADGVLRGFNSYTASGGKLASVPMGVSLNYKKGSQIMRYEALRDGQGGVLLVHPFKLSPLSDFQPL